MTTVKTNLTIGNVKDFKFGENLHHAVTMHDNPEFTKDYDSLEDFLKDFEPTIPSDNLIKRISQEFEQLGKITFKPKGFKANQNFYFSK